MNYQLLKSMNKYGIKKEDVCFKTLGIKGEEVCKNVILAPAYEPEIFNSLRPKINQVSNGYYKVYHVEIGKVKFNYIITHRGSVNVGEIVAGLGFSKCENIIFIGSVGSLHEKINIGDVCLPEKSVIADGFCRFFEEGDMKARDLFGEVIEPSDNLLNLVSEVLESEKINYHVTNNFSTETIIGQFARIDEIKNMNCNTIEMETSTIFYMSKKLGMNAVAIHNVSDNTINSKSLLGGRTKADKQKKYDTKYNVLPQILIKLLQKL